MWSDFYTLGNGTQRNSNLNDHGLCFINDEDQSHLKNIFKVFKDKKNYYISKKYILHEYDKIKTYLGKRKPTEFVSNRAAQLGIVNVDPQTAMEIQVFGNKQQASEV